MKKLDTEAQITLGENQCAAYVGHFVLWCSIYTVKFLVLLVVLAVCVVLTLIAWVFTHPVEFFYWAWLTYK